MDNSLWEIDPIKAAFLINIYTVIVISSYLRSPTVTQEVKKARRSSEEVELCDLSVFTVCLLVIWENETLRCQVQSDGSEFWSDL